MTTGLLTPLPSTAVPSSAYIWEQPARTYRSAPFALRATISVVQ